MQKQVSIFWLETPFCHFDKIVATFRMGGWSEGYFKQRGEVRPGAQLVVQVTFNYYFRQGNKKFCNKTKRNETKFSYKRATTILLEDSITARQMSGTAEEILTKTQIHEQTNKQTDRRTKGGRDKQTGVEIDS